MAARRKMTRWQRAMAWWKAHRARISALWPLVTVGAFGGYVSFGHIRYVTADHLSAAHNLPGVPLIMPIIIDVMMVACARYVGHAKTFTGKTLAMLGFASGFAASLACNMLAATPGTWGMLTAGWPAWSVLITAMVWHFGGKRPRSVHEVARAATRRAELRAARKGIVPERPAPAPRPERPARPGRGKATVAQGSPLSNGHNGSKTPTLEIPALPSLIVPAIEAAPPYATAYGRG